MGVVPPVEVRTIRVVAAVLEREGRYLITQRRASAVLVSVTQRTREIGVRRAMGAPRAQIMREVVAESALTAVIGGVVGLIVAVGLVTAAAGVLDLPLDVRLSTAGWSLVASAASGLVAGWYPARRATRLTVVEAIRAE